MASKEDSVSLIEGNPQPFISIIIYNYDVDKLASCFDAILDQKKITSLELIVCDDATIDGSWEIANQYMHLYPNVITLTRNQVPLGPKDNADKGQKMARGQYCVELTRDRKFDVVYVARIIEQLELDLVVMHAYIGKVNQMLPHANSYNLPSPEMKRSGNPLVSICVYNYNYGRFLQQCLDSVAAQTYSNIEICFSDNASTDDSWKVALEFSQQYSGKMNLTRNRMNFGASSNLENCWLNTRGKYMLMLCTDDAMRPDFIERCVTLLEQNKDAAFAMVHRDIIDDDNNLTSELPFYNQTCLIPGYEQAAVYMMAAVNPSVSQILYNWERSQGSGKLGGFNYRWFGIRILDFSICCEYPIVYIHEPLLLNRVHSLSDGTVIDANLLQCMGQYVLLHQLAEIALVAGLEKAGGRLNGGLEKIGKLCLRYCVRFLLDDNEEVARRYLYLGQAILPNIVMDESFGLLQRYWDSGVTEGGKREILDILQNQANLATRLVSYDPPPGSIRC